MKTEQREANPLLRLEGRWALSSSRSLPLSSSSLPYCSRASITQEWMPIKREECDMVPTRVLKCRRGLL